MSIGNRGGAGCATYERSQKTQEDQRPLVEAGDTASPGRTQRGRQPQRTARHSHYEELQAPGGGIAQDTRRHPSDMKPRHGLCLLLANIAAFATLAAASSTQTSSAESPCVGVAAEDPVAPRLPLEDEAAAEEAEAKGGGGGDHVEPVKRVGFNAWGGKRVGFNAWGGKRGASDGSAFRGGALGWVLGLRDGLRGAGGASGPGSQEEANKRVGFNAWGGKRSRFNAWGGKRGSEGKVPKAFFPWGGKRSGGGEDDEDGARGSVEWLYTGQPEEYVGVRKGGEGDSGEAWGQPFGRGRRSPTSSRNHLIATVEDPTITEGLPWEHKRWNALWRAATNLQPPRQNRRAAGADFFPWGGKRSSLYGPLSE